MPSLPRREGRRNGGFHAALPKQCGFLISTFVKTRSGHICCLAYSGSWQSLDARGEHAQSKKLLALFPQDGFAGGAKSQEIFIWCES
jgi:hypothetical protein